MLDLLADRALEGLSEEQELELAELVERCPVEDEEAFDALAAELCVASVKGPEEVPEHLQRRLRDALERGQLNVPTSERPLVATATPPARTTAQVRWSEIAGWLVAVVCLVLAVSPSLLMPPPNDVEAPVVPSAVALREALLDEADDLVRLDWSGGPTAPEKPEDFAFGDVVWSPSRQEGYMRFRGLPVNDPGKEQYQLWIFDATRNEAHPVDGGVFDVTVAGETVIPVVPKLLVREATLFAITVEPPGGVVVSDRSRLPLLAQVPAT